MRLCVDCANFASGTRECVIETAWPDFVFGGMLKLHKDARYMRSYGAECGPEGKLFVAKAEGLVRHPRSGDPTSAPDVGEP